MNKKRILAVVTARKGSKGIPQKNIKELGGKPLIEYTIEAALKCPSIDKVIVSTDCEKIAQIAKNVGASVPFLRPEELATDTSTSIDVVEHVLMNLGEQYDSIVLLQPTSPLRNERHLNEAINLHMAHDGKSVVSVTQSNKSPFWMYWCSDEKMTPILGKSEQTLARRQETPQAYNLNGAIYISDCANLLKERAFINDFTVPYKMLIEDSIDIDTPTDFAIAELTLSARQS